ncbi:DUF2848 domain-containing protein [Komagataeibacter intermedius]|nr:DUF2848 domain-containing protein [Komagataeibacter intermedius]
MTQDGQDHITCAPNRLIIAGWAGRDMAAIEEHIVELEAIGVPRPSSVPVYYRVARDLLLQADRVQILGSTSSGEVEPVLLALADGWWVGIGSDHTDREAETIGIALSKQLCCKPVSRVLWKWEDVADHWDMLIMRSWATIDGMRVLYQEGPVNSLRAPDNLVDNLPDTIAFTPGDMMFCGTLSVKGGIRPAQRFEMELEDPVLKRSIRHAYDLDMLPVVS